MSKETVTVVLNEENALPFLRTALGAMRSGEAALICFRAIALKAGLKRLLILVKAGSPLSATRRNLRLYPGGLRWSVTGAGK